jgi:RNA polymerase sigma-B factor
MTPVATEPDVIELLDAHRAGDESARDKLVEQYMPLVRKIASRYSGRGEPLEDLVQVGSIGLVLAINRFDVERGVKFTTYAVPTIVGEIQRHFRDRAWAVHVPRRMKELSLKLARTIEARTADLGRSPTIAELAAETGLEEEEVVEALETYHAYSTRSLSQPLGLGDSEEGTVEDLFGAPDPGYDDVEHGALLETGLAALDERERTIVELRFFDGLTQSEIAARIGISQMHVSRLLRRSLTIMRGRLEGAVTEQGS